MLVGGLVLPHPPVILPEHAGSRGPEVEPTIEAVRRACRWAAGLKPDRVHISSPHPGHGFEVPLTFLTDATGRLPASRFLTELEPYEPYFELGEELRAAEDSDPSRTLLVASGDCSHRLEGTAPGGFHPDGPRLDAAIRKGVAAGRAELLLAIDRGTARRGGECGLRSFIYGLAAVRPEQVEVLSYQAPYGVGYLVATLHAWKPMTPGAAPTVG